MPKLTTRKKLIKKLDKIFSKIVRTKNPSCFICGSTKNLTCGHLISRSNYSVRWDFENAETQCKSCNFNHEHHPEIFTYKYIQKYGLEKYANLVLRSKQKKKFSDKDLEELYGDLENLFKELLCQRDV